MYLTVVQQKASNRCKTTPPSYVRASISSKSSSRVFLVRGTNFSSKRKRRPIQNTKRKKNSQKSPRHEKRREKRKYGYVRGACISRVCVRGNVCPFAELAAQPSPLQQPTGNMVLCPENIKSILTLVITTLTAFTFLRGVV